MSSKTKQGKERLDKYYYLAKEQGYRARSAFKILQLAKKYNIFENCNVLVDLCAAPGGWLQVAAKQMPVSSIIVGVDLVPIRPIKGVKTIQADIRTPRCRNLISQNLKGSPVDVVLHDGAPNVGANWNLDAFNQNVLVLEAAKLAANILRKGGVFVTKIFRSADFNSVIWMLGKCFDRVKVTKPSSSRNVSAEIFAVCLGFKSLKGLDPKLFNPEHVFVSQGAVETSEPVKGLSLNQLLKQRKKVNREGYEEGDDFRECTVLDFLKSDNAPQILVSMNRIVFKVSDSGTDEDRRILKEVLENPLTTDEVKLLCSDLKVAGKTDLQHLMKWRYKLNKVLSPLEKKGKSSSEALETDDEEDNADVSSEESDSGLTKQQLEIADRLRKEQRRSERKKRRALMKHKKAMVGSSSIIETDHDLFSLSVLKGRDIDEVSDATDAYSSDEDSMNLQFETDSEEEDDEEGRDRVMELDVDLELQHEMAKQAESEKVKPAKKLTRRQKVNMERGAELSSLLDNMQYEARLMAQQEMKDSSSDDESDDEIPQVDMTSSFEPDMDGIVDAKSTKDAKEEIMVDRWFDQDIFHEQPRETARKQKSKQPKQAEKAKQKTSFDVVKAISDADAIEKVKDAVEMELTKDKDTIAEVQAIGSLLVNKKSRMAVIDGAYNKRTFDDVELPSWFVEDEKRHSNYELPVTKEMMKKYKAKLYELKNRPIRKVMEAKGRKKMRMERKLKSILPKVEALQNSETGKSDRAKKLLRKVKNAASDKREKVYVVSRRGGVGNVASSGGKGKGSRKVVKPVDRRMKKDNIRQKRKPKSKSRKARIH
ncbi:hypothetical protein BgAZ_110340 [Babesia gibsoni]|uniref:Putative rRNA methyltransferase n=1 Tax=Babesia gibsoni TaxID=33632 RepID=A0AAD8PH17_BABGI|nr:hypothetical protein BgAZ_110340 [Babesia gibsoni]